MLHIYFPNEVEEQCKDKEVITNVEKAFRMVQLTGSDVEKNLISEIEKGQYVNENTFVDRFGVRLYVSELSTGCKAALCVANCLDSIIDTIECGTNARDAIVYYCTEGCIIFRDPYIDISGFEGKISVCVADREFKSVKELNNFLEWEVR